MKQTNYHLFDFMDFDPSLHKDEALWKAYAPTKIVERNGDIIVTIPYQQQLRQEEMAPDTSVAQQAYDLIIRAYEPNIIRLFSTMSGDEMKEEDDMLQMAPEVKQLPLRYADDNIITVNGIKVAHIDLGDPIIDYWTTCCQHHSQHRLSPFILTVTRAKALPSTLRRIIRFL